MQKEIDPLLTMAIFCSCPHLGGRARPEAPKSPTQPDQTYPAPGHDVQTSVSGPVSQSTRPNWWTGTFDQLESSNARQEQD